MADDKRCNRCAARLECILPQFCGHNIKPLPETFWEESKGPLGITFYARRKKYIHNLNRKVET